MAEYQKSQFNEINAGKKAGIDTSVYEDPKFNGKQMYQIRKGLEAGIDVYVYLDEELTNHQMEQVRLGLEDGIPADMVKLYAKPGFSVTRMEQLRLCMKYEVTTIEDTYSVMGLDMIRIAIRNGFDLTQYIGPEIDEDHMMVHHEEDTADMVKEFAEMVEDMLGEAKEECACSKCEAPTMQVEKKKGFFRRLFRK